METAVRIVGAFSIVMFTLPLTAFAAAQCAKPPGFPNQAYNTQGKVITYYVPHNAQNCVSSIEGCIATSCPGLKDNLSKPTCLDAVRLGEAKYVTIASAESNYGKYFNLGTITYRSALDGKMYTVQNVVGYVHDTGCAFNGTCSEKLRQKYGFSSVPRPDKLDVCTTVCPTCTDKEAGELAQGKNVNLIRTAEGIPDPNNSTLSNNQFKPASPFQWTQTPLGYPTQPAYPSQQAFPSNGLAQPSQLAQPSSNLASPTSPYNISTSAGVSTDSNSISSNGGSAVVVKDGLRALNIIAQPQTVRRGASVLISWTSVNYAEGSCTVTRGSTTLASGNVGTQRLLIPQEASGQMTFRLTCMLPDNSMKQASAMITIQ